MTQAWFAYWRPEDVRALHSPFLMHFASNKLELVDPGDTIWIVSTDYRDGLITMGYFHVTEILSWAEARRRLPYRPRDSRFHVVVTGRAAVRAQRVSLESIFGKIRFDSPTRPRLKRERGRRVGHQLQQMRRLTPATAELVRQVWKRGATGQQKTFDTVTKNLDDLGELDGRYMKAVRKEQGFLRDFLFGDDLVGRCVLCGREFPRGLLVAAHVKPRAKCSPTQRKDYTRNIVAMCKLGCDDLFERGIVAVEGGTIVLRDSSQLTDAIREYAGRIKNRKCAAYTDQSAKYFDWHAQHVRFGADM